jgi:hypothetical protein
VKEKEYENSLKCVFHSLWIPDRQRSLLLAVRLRDENTIDRLEPMTARMMDVCRHMDGVCLPRCLGLEVQLHREPTQAGNSPQALARFQCQYLCTAALWQKRSQA